MSDPTTLLAPGDSVAYRARITSNNGLVGTRTLGTATLPPEIPENTLTFDGVPLVFNGAYVVFTPSS